MASVRIGQEPINCMQHKTHSYPRLKCTMPCMDIVCFCRLERRRMGRREKGDRHSASSTWCHNAPRMASFCSPKCWTEEKDRHKEQTGLSAGHALCHGRSQAAGQSRQLPGHLVSPLPAALTWHKVDCRPPAGPGSPQQWSFSHEETRAHTHTRTRMHAGARTHDEGTVEH